MMQKFVKKEITPEVVKTFLEGHDQQEKIVNLEYSYGDDFIKVYYRDEEDNKCLVREPFYPFLWAKKSACLKLCDGDRQMIKALMGKYNIGVKSLDVTNKDGEVVKEIADDGYTYMFFARKAMSYSQFLEFFKKAGNPVYKDKKKDEQPLLSKKEERQYLAVTPQEQYLISTGKRFFKGYEDYDETLRLIFDLETTGLNTKKDRIEQFGIRFNRPVKYKGKYINFERIYSTEGETEEEKNRSELKNIITFLKILYTFKPDVITAHNGETFDWQMIIDACDRLGHPLEELSKKYFNEERGIVKNNRETVLKLGGEIETFHQTLVPTCIVTDSLHAVRRAQAIDSNMLFSNLKYVTKYSKIVKKDRVYIPGNKISTIWNSNLPYALNKEDGDWYIYDQSAPSSNVVKRGKDEETFTVFTKNTLYEGYDVVSGREIAQRYLLDDLWECDKVEHRYNIPNFLICKMLPVPFQKCCTMGTAGQWKSLLLAWSYENDLAIPPFGERHSFTGGLSRLMRVGYVKDVIKLDYNSLYPSIILTWAITDAKDLMYTMLAFLEHVLTNREKFKKLMKSAGKKIEQMKESEGYDKNELLYWEGEKAANDKKQLPLKILGNSFFGSYGAPNVFPWGSIDCAERTTCTGRQALRLMICKFNELGYTPIVGDSFTEDTPLFIKYKSNGLVDIKPISELIDESKIEVDDLGREYDYSKKDFFVLCRSGWVEPTYIYRHNTDKDIYEVSDGEMKVEVTEDHSLFNDKQEKIKPSEVNKNTKLEYYTKEIEVNSQRYFENQAPYINEIALALANGEIDRVPLKVLNYSKHYKKMFYEKFMENYKDNVKFSKTCLAGLMFINSSIS